MTYQDLYRKGSAYLQEVQIPEYALDARLLLEYVCGTNRNDLLAHGDKEVSEEQQKRFDDLIMKRGQHIPLQHLTQEQDFMGLTFFVNEHVLIPRQDTECLVEVMMKELHDGMRILDMCTGSGCILLSLLYYSNDCIGVGVDKSVQALEVARKNAELIGRQKKQNCGMVEDSDIHVNFVESDLFQKVEGRFDMIVSNPPYIRTEVIETLMPEVRDYEPRMALDGKDDGLFFYREIIDKSRKHLIRGGVLGFEIGFEQGEEVLKLMEKAGFCDVKVVKDLAGLDRVVYGICLNIE